MKWLLEKRLRAAGGLPLAFIFSLACWSDVQAQDPSELAVVPPANSSGTSVGRNDAPANSAVETSGLSPTLERISIRCRAPHPAISFVGRWPRTVSWLPRVLR